MSRQKETYILLFVMVIAALMVSCNLFFVDNNANKQPFKLKVAEQEFYIPRGYVWASDGSKNGYIVRPNLHTLYPHFEPKTSQNQDKFDQNGWADGQLISFLIKSYKQSKPISEVFELQLASATLPGKKNTESGLYFYNLPRKQELYALNDENNIFFVCSDNSVPFPSCNTRIHFSDDIYIYAVFSKERLPEWKTVRQGLIDKITSFQLAAKAVRLQQEVNNVN